MAETGNTNVNAGPAGTPAWIGQLVKTLRRGEIIAMNRAASTMSSSQRRILATRVGCQK